MSGISIKMEGKSNGNLDGIVRSLKREINAELLWQNNRYLGDVTVAILSFEKYYFRNGSYASLTVVLTDDGTEMTADIIGSGGGEGLFNLSFGANSNFAGAAQKILEASGFMVSARVGERNW